MLNWRLAILVLLMTAGRLVYGASDQSAGTAVPDAPNIIILLLDTLRADHLECYGYPKQFAPFLSEVARDARIFDRAFSTSSWTAPSITSLITGLYPPQHGVLWGFFIHKKRVEAAQAEGRDTNGIQLPCIPKDRPTLVELLKARGYACYGVTTNINPREETGFTRGFDRFERFGDRSADVLVDHLAGWKDEIRAARPYFIYAHFNDVHDPYVARKPWYVPADDTFEDARARYLSELGNMDAEIRRFFAEFEIGHDDLVIVLSDHGEEFGDHGGLGHGPTLYFELNRIVCFVRGPGIVPGRSPCNVSLVDILPTVAQFAALPLPEGLPGRSLKPLCVESVGPETGAEFDSRILFAHRLDEYNNANVVWSASQGLWKFIEWEGQRKALFDHRTDTAERYDVQHENPAVFERLEGEVLRFRQSVTAPRSPATTTIPVDQELYDALEALGYVK